MTICCFVTLNVQRKLHGMLATIYVKGVWGNIDWENLRWISFLPDMHNHILIYLP